MRRSQKNPTETLLQTLHKGISFTWLTIGCGTNSSTSESFHPYKILPPQWLSSVHVNNQIKITNEIWHFCLLWIEKGNPLFYFSCFWQNVIYLLRYFLFFLLSGCLHNTRRKVQGMKAAAQSWSIYSEMHHVKNKLIWRQAVLFDWTSIRSHWHLSL